MRGRLVWRRNVPAGQDRAVWQGLDARNRPAARGTYLLKLERGKKAWLKKALLLK
jgi:hypothetical protein